MHFRICCIDLINCYTINIQKTVTPVVIRLKKNLFGSGKLIEYLASAVTAVPSNLCFGSSQRTKILFYLLSVSAAELMLFGSQCRSAILRYNILLMMMLYRQLAFINWRKKKLYVVNGYKVYRKTYVFMIKYCAIYWLQQIVRPCLSIVCLFVWWVCLLVRYILWQFSWRLCFLF